AAVLVVLRQGSRPRRAVQAVAQEQCGRRRRQPEAGDQVRHVRRDRGRAILRARLPHRRRNPRLARRLPLGDAHGGARLMSGTPQTADGVRRDATSHEGFLRHRNFRWLKIAIIVSLVALVAYLAADVRPRPNGGSWLGYTLGTVGALLIVWLS